LDKPVLVTIGGNAYALRYDFAAFRAIEDRTGKSILRDGYTSDDLRDTAFFVVSLWAGVAHAAPTLTLRDVEQGIFLRDYAALADAIMLALKQSAGEADEDSAHPPQAQASDGPTSGA